LSPNRQMIAAKYFTNTNIKIKATLPFLNFVVLNKTDQRFNK
jgi:hypothetical protein